MSPKYSNWSVQARDRHVDEFHVQTVVVVTDPGRYEWELTTDRDGAVTFFAMSAFGAPLTEDALVHVPLADLARIAQTFTERVRESYADTGDLRDALLVSQIDPTDVRRTLDGQPDLAEFAAEWQEMGPRTLTGLPRRQALAAKFGISPYTVDAWVKRARAADLLPKPTTGRGNRRQPRYPQRKEN